MTTRAPTPDILGNIMAGMPAAAAPAVTMLALSSIVNDGGTQMRAGMNADTVKEYEDALTDAEAWPFPPVIVYHDGARYWLADGFHRLNAAHRSGKFAEIPADIKPGTRRDAVLFAAGANASHGLRRTDADKRRSVEMLLLDDEWGKWSNMEIARRCNVGEKLVRQMKKDLGIDTSAETKYIHPKTGETTTMQTTNIGANRPDPPAMLAVWELEKTAREVYAQVYGGNPEPYATRDMRTSAKMRAGRFWLLCTQSLPVNQFRLSDLAQAINNFAAQIEAQRNGTNAQPNPILPAYSSYRTSTPANYTVPEAVEDKPLPDWATDAAPEQDAPESVDRQDKLVQLLIDATRDEYAEWILAAAEGKHPRIFIMCENLALREQYFGCDLKAALRKVSQWRYDADQIAPANPRPVELMLKRAATPEPAEAPATVAQTVEDVVEVHGEPDPSPEPAEVLPVSQRTDYESDEWYTPAEYIDAARQVMGGIDLDPASSELAQTVVQAGAYLTKWENGLAMGAWIHKRVWLNPPYSNPGPWIEMLIAQHDKGVYCTEAIVLVNNATETSWFQLLLERFPVCLPARRIAFWRHDHANVGARQGQAFFYLGPNGDRFEEVFRQFGPILRRVA